MALHFPNASRSHDARRRCVSFWGHDASFEIAFHLADDAIGKISASALADEAALLSAFDANRARIETVAAGAYSRGRRNYVELSASDF
jgi:hypothetical protein